VQQARRLLWVVIWGAACIFCLVSATVTRAVAKDHIVKCAAFTPDGERLAIGYRGGRVVVRDINPGSKSRRLCRHSEDVTILAFSPDGRLLATGGRDGAVMLWDTETRKLRRILTGYESYLIRGLVFLNPNELLTSTGAEIVIWNLMTMNKRSPLPEAEGRALAGPIAVHLEKGLLLTTTVDCMEPASDLEIRTDRLVLCDFRGRRILETYDLQTGTIHAVAISSDARILAVATHYGVYLITRGQGKSRVLRSPSSLFYSLHFLRSDSLLLAHGPLGLRIWSVPDGVQIGSELETLRGSAMALSPDGIHLALPQGWFRMQVINGQYDLPDRNCIEAARARWSRLIGKWTLLPKNDLGWLREVEDMEITFRTDGTFTVSLQVRQEGKVEHLEYPGVFWLDGPRVQLLGENASTFEGTCLTLMDSELVLQHRNWVGSARLVRAALDSKKLP